MNRILFLLIIILFARIPSVSGQPGNHKLHKKQMQERKIQYIKETLQLTKSEEAALIPLLNQMDDEMEALHKKNRDLMHRFEENHLNLSDEEIRAMNDEMVKIFETEAQIKTNYHKKISKILPPVKVFLLYKAKGDFKRMLIREFKGHGRHGCVSPLGMPTCEDLPPPEDRG